ncbi:hypothetical protein BC833DRAFT_572062 [Globomyces pollinis-pini]|nr:hypothetical protein BC833DRAFT_572062 [Globomyces pollinis-pini]
MELGLSYLRRSDSNHQRMMDVESSLNAFESGFQKVMKSTVFTVEQKSHLKSQFLLNIGISLRYLCDESSAYKSFDLALQIALQHNDLDAQATIYENLSLLYDEKFDSKNALKYGKLCCSIHKSLGDNMNEIRISQSNINRLMKLQMFTEATNSLKRIKYLENEMKNAENVSESMDWLTDDIQSLESVLHHCMDNLMVVHELKDEISNACSENNLKREFELRLKSGDLQLELNLTDRAKLDYYRLIDIMEMLKIFENMRSHIQFSLGKSFLLEGDSLNASKHIRLGLEICKDNIPERIVHMRLLYDALVLRGYKKTADFMVVVEKLLLETLELEEEVHDFGLQENTVERLLKLYRYFDLPNRIKEETARLTRIRKVLMVRSEDSSPEGLNDSEKDYSLFDSNEADFNDAIEVVRPLKKQKEAHKVTLKSVSKYPMNFDFNDYEVQNDSYGIMADTKTSMAKEIGCCVSSPDLDCEAIGHESLEYVHLTHSAQNQCKERQEIDQSKIEDGCQIVNNNHEHDLATSPVGEGYADFIKIEYGEDKKKLELVDYSDSDTFQHLMNKFIDIYKIKHGETIEKLRLFDEDEEMLSPMYRINDILVSGTTVTASFKTNLSKERK